MFLELVGYLLVALLLSVILGILPLSLVTFRNLASKIPPPQTPREPVRPSWIRLNDDYALLTILDFMFVGIFLGISRYSQLSQTVALYLMVLFLPVVYLMATFFRDGFIDLVYRDCYFDFRDPATILWVTSSVAKTLLHLHRRNGVNYLRKSLFSARRLFER